MNNSLISKYIPLDTVIHNLDPRTKLFFVIVYLEQLHFCQKRALICCYQV